MTNSGDRETHNSETRQESYTDIQGNTHTNLTRTSETVNNNPNHVNTYKNGYANGRETERHYQQANLAARDHENASVGLLLGIFLTSVAGLIVGAFWYFNQPRETVIQETQPIVTPSPQQTTIIERTTEVPVVVPQPQVPTVTIPSPPDINITVPPQQPTTSGTQTTPPRDSSADTPAAGSKTNTSETTVPQRSNQSNDTSNSGSSNTGETGTGSE
ncbi:hypothetical protein IQ259_10630 [Fortiea sp. LEGE XX443]|uniref:hypothetical protein n=1 Tax=Fortiea sp. LEGE XX443 TaxID=1828611 RepID=UPI00188250E9|nr:hypothetical protein [Fortiea sp. LEGE XX443]MBE9005489.1 hypothetical protein [Fortiea sp. LEGE XX443]